VKTHPVIGQLVQYRKVLDFLCNAPECYSIFAFINLLYGFWQLLSQLESAGEEVEDEITRSKELLAKDNGEQQLLSQLHEDESHSVVMNQPANNSNNTKVVPATQTHLIKYSPPSL